jgi:hypothetical protein
MLIGQSQHFTNVVAFILSLLIHCPIFHVYEWEWRNDMNTIFNAIDICFGGGGAGGGTIAVVPRTGFTCINSNIVSTVQQ